MRSRPPLGITHAQPPGFASMLGYAGLLPQAAVVVVLASDTPWHFAALSLGYAYAALILSFLGGTWWGFATRKTDQSPGWLWLAAIIPSLIGLGTAVPWAIGASWPGPSMAVLGVSLLASLLVDRWLAKAGLAPEWWMSLRVPLSVGLGSLTMAAAAIG